eukprot:s235_g19.t1
MGLLQIQTHRRSDLAASTGGSIGIRNRSSTYPRTTSKFERRLRTLTSEAQSDPEAAWAIFWSRPSRSPLKGRTAFVNTTFSVPDIGATASLIDQALFEGDLVLYESQRAVSLLEDLRSGGWPIWAPMPKVKGVSDMPTVTCESLAEEEKTVERCGVVNTHRKVRLSIGVYDENIKATGYELLGILETTSHAGMMSCSVAMDVAPAFLSVQRCDLRCHEQQLDLGIMTRSGVILPAILALALVYSLAPSFVAPARATAQDSTVATANGAVVPAGVAALLASAPAPAHAFSETELNQFGLVFAIFFLGFFIAGLVRMFTVGKL